ncbi:hypothetical protein PVAP13_3KG242827 [Panicum virgatum]|uniref:Uncharacterized protein n=1 Tax=Panicum virgatum TaxID=38727 RepID=A0A8T0UW97_PANVG|nr:hypothetical protein PVAP13_3KG242827 [Panicum virgatum]
MLAALLSRWRRLKHSFSLIALCTSSFHHQVSFPSCLPPLLMPNTSEATFRTHIAIFSHMSSVSSPSSQGPSPSILSLNTCAASPLSFHHFVLAILARLSQWTRTRRRKSATTSLGQHTPQVSPYNLSNHIYPPS